MGKFKKGVRSMKSDKLMRWAIIIACFIFSGSAIMGAINSRAEDKDTEDTGNETAAVLQVEG